MGALGGVVAWGGVGALGGVVAWGGVVACGRLGHTFPVDCMENPSSYKVIVASFSY